MGTQTFESMYASQEMQESDYIKVSKLEADVNFAKGIMTFVYLTVFILGVPGNVWIIFKLLRSNLFASINLQMTVSQRSRIYIFALACSDLLLLLTLPPTASYNYHGAWVFGEIPCYVVRTFEMFAKLFSVTLLTVMSLERYIVVCTRFFYSFRPVYRFWLALMPVLLLTIFFVIGPTLFHLYYLKHLTVADLLDTNDYRKSEPALTEVWLCLPTMTNFAFNAFAQYTFVAGFIVPFIVMTTCYILLVRHLRLKYQKRQANLPSTSSSKNRSPRYMCEVRRSIWRIAVYHFLCWAPFWAFTMTPHYMDTFFKPGYQFFGGIDSVTFAYARLVFNCLPYINAAGNWVLYAFLNYDVRKYIYKAPQKRSKTSSRFQPVATSSV